MQNKKETNRNNERRSRIESIKLMREKKIAPFGSKYSKDTNLDQIKKIAVGARVKSAGRVVLLRDMGKITFAHLQDFFGRAQIIFKEDIVGEKEYKAMLDFLNMGDLLGIEGEVFVTKKGEISIMVKKYEFLSKAMRPLPEKWHGIKDAELKYRKRYLDLIMNEETKKRFIVRSQFLWELRNYYYNNGFIEVETPILCNTPSGALAKPFKTHHNAYGDDVYLRIAPEIYLKEAIIGGFEKIYEVARSFRNEGVDPSHLQDFTMVEHYCAYWDYKMNMHFTEQMLTEIIKKINGELKIEILNRKGELVKVDLSLPWKTVSFKNLILRDCGINIDEFPDVKDLRNIIKKKKISIDKIENLGLGNLIDALYKAVSREKIVEPTFLIHHPIDISPLARRSDYNPMVTDRFQLVINGWEIVNAYSELIDPADQKERFEKQMDMRRQGDEEAMFKDDEFVEAMEYGMPPVSGWGMGVDRMVALLTQQPNLRDVVMFPLLKIDK